MYNDGVESKLEDKKIRLFMVRQEDKVLEVVEIPRHAKNMNKGDSFVLDNGSKVFLWSGDETSVHERYTAVRVQTRLRNWRMGRAEKADAHTDDEVRPRLCSRNRHGFTQLFLVLDLVGRRGE